MLRAREWSIEIFSLATRKRRQERCLSRLGQCSRTFVHTFMFTKEPPIALGIACLFPSGFSLPHMMQMETRVKKAASPKPRSSEFLRNSMPVPPPRSFGAAVCRLCSCAWLDELHQYGQRKPHLTVRENVAECCNPWQQPEMSSPWIVIMYVVLSVVAVAPKVT